MAGKPESSPELSKKAFLHLAELVGLTPNDPHLEELYPVVKNTLKALEPLDKLDLTGVQPDLIFSPGVER